MGCPASSGGTTAKDARMLLSLRILPSEVPDPGTAGAGLTKTRPREHRDVFRTPRRGDRGGPISPAGQLGDARSSAPPATSCRGRALSYPNDMSANGESALQRWILRISRPGDQIHVADVGANVGRWSESMLAAVSAAGRETDFPPARLRAETRGPSRGSRRCSKARPPASAGRHSATGKGPRPSTWSLPRPGRTLCTRYQARTRRRRITWSRSRWIHTPANPVSPVSRWSRSMPRDTTSPYCTGRAPCSLSIGLR